MTKYIFFTNIPAPYRISFYDELHKLGFNFEVYYMRITEADRSWKIDTNSMKHSFYIDRGFYRMIGHYHFHFNPKLIMKLLRSKGAEIIVGASWNDIDLLILLVLKRIGLFKNQIHFWTEANYLTIGASNDNIVKKLVRKFVYNSSNGAQISSGKMTEITLRKWGIKDKTFVPLPNTIEEDKFTVSGEEISARHQNATPVFLLPVRLIENIKGVVNFFTSIGADNIRKGLFLIAGDGPDAELIQRFIDSHGVGEHIKLLGFCNTDKMVSLYKRANVLVLPSYSDPSPLTLIEALVMELPLLVSERCGNHFEAVAEGENGYLFNPLDPASVKAAFESLLLRIDDWRSMGLISRTRYSALFDKQLVLGNFIRGLTEFSCSTKTQ